MESLKKAVVEAVFYDARTGEIYSQYSMKKEVMFGKSSLSGLQFLDRIKECHRRAMSVFPFCSVNIVIRSKDFEDSDALSRRLSIAFSEDYNTSSLPF